MLTPTMFAERITKSTPKALHPLVRTFVLEWTLGLYYVVSELWASVVCALLFWQVANDVMSIQQAKAYYPIVGAMGNLGMVVAGRTLRLFADQRDDILSAQAYLRISLSEHAQRRLFGGNSTSHMNLFHRGNQDEDARQELLRDGWIGTLLGIGALMVASGLVIGYCYDVVYRRLYLHYPHHTLHRCR